MSPRSREPTPPHFARPELPACVGWRARRRWPLGVTVQTQALQHLDGLLGWRQAVWEDEDPEAVHQLRVHTRRLRSCLQTFASLWPPEDARRWIRELGRFARAFGDARDLDVHLEDSEDWCLQDEAAARAAAWLRGRWSDHRTELRDELRRALVRFEQAWTPQRLMEFLSTSPLDLWRWSAEHRPSGKRRTSPSTPASDAPGAEAAGGSADPADPTDGSGNGAPVVHGGVLFDDPQDVPPALPDDDGDRDDDGVRPHQTPASRSARRTPRA